VSSQGKTNIVDHILIPYNKIVEEIFIEKVPSGKYNMFDNGKFVNRVEFSKKLMEYLQGKDFQFYPDNLTYLRARRSVFGIEMTIQKNYQGDKIKELVLAIPSQTYPELLNKREIIITGLTSIIPGINIQISTADKYVRC
jgi:hypothetical protein